MKLKRALLVVLLLVSLPLAGCGKGGDGGGGPGTESSEDIPTLQEFFEDNYADAAWFAALDEVIQTRKLRHDVTEIRFGASAQEVRDQYLADLNAAVAAWVGETGLSLYVDIYGSDTKAGGFGNLVGEGVALELPPPPASIGELSDWMDAAYGPGSGDEVEAWYEHITGYDTREDQYSGETVVQVFTDLVYSTEMDADYEMAELIRTALGTANITWASQSEVVYGDGDNIQSGQIAWPNPYAGY